MRLTSPVSREFSQEIVVTIQVQHGKSRTYEAAQVSFSWWLISVKVFIKFSFLISHIMKFLQLQEYFIILHSNHHFIYPPATLDSEYEKHILIK